VWRDEYFCICKNGRRYPKAVSEYEKILHPIGNYSIKHGEELVIYNVYGEGFGIRLLLEKPKVFAPNLQRDIRTENNFSFNRF